MWPVVCPQWAQNRGNVGYKRLNVPMIMSGSILTTIHLLMNNKIFEDGRYVYTIFELYI